MANFVIIGRAPCIVEDSLFLDVAHVLEAQGPALALPPYLETEVILPLAALPEADVQERWFTDEQWVIIEADTPPHLVREESGEGDRVIQWHGLSVRVATDDEVQKLTIQRRAAKGSRTVERERRRAERDRRQSDDDRKPQ